MCGCRPLASFRVARFELSLRPIEPLALPPEAGSTLRGAFGRAFQRIGCAASTVGATRCSLGERCPYHYVFETPVSPDSQILTKVDTAPRPFVIEPPLTTTRVYDPGMTLTLGLVLVGRAIDYLPYFIHAFEETGKDGLGAGRGRYRLESVATTTAGSSATVYRGSTRRLIADPETLELDAPVLTSPDERRRVTLDFLTPTRFQYGGESAGPREFHVVFRNLLRRISFLNYFHCGGALLDDAFDRVETAKAVATEAAHLRWCAWERYSARQGQRVPMTGVTGRVTYEGDVATFWPWLALGELVHVGKGAAFGLGRYRMDLDD